MTSRLYQVPDIVVTKKICDNSKGVVTMPNWCENDLKVMSRTKTGLQKFMKAVACKDDDTVFKISNIVPIPQSLRDVSAGSEESLYEILHGTEEQFNSFKKLVKLSGDRESVFEEYVTNKWSGPIQLESKSMVINSELSSADKMVMAKKLVEVYKHNVDVYGHLTWYSWCVENWGTKWDVAEANVDEISLSKSGKAYSVLYNFETAWSPPTRAILSMSQLYTDLIFKLRYYERGCGFKGMFTVRGGAIMKDETFDYNGPRGG